MAYTYTNSKGQSYILHSQQMTLKNGAAQTIYFFAKDKRASALDNVPTGYKVSESKNGLPILQRIK